MLPVTKQATSTEVEGNTTVEVTGTTESGQSLQGLVNPEPEKQTAVSQPEEGEGESQQTETTLSEKAPRTERRMEKLIDKLKEKTDVESELRKELNSYRAQPHKEEPLLPPWAQSVPQGEITPEAYQAQVVGTANSLVEAKLSSYQQKVLQYQDFKDDLAYVESQYPALNKDAETYQPEQVKKVTKLFKLAQQSDPNVRLKDVVDDIMSFHQAGQEVGKKEMTASVVKRQAEAAVSPSPITGEQRDASSDWDSMNLKQKEEWMKANGIWDK